MSEDVQPIYLQPLLENSKLSELTMPIFMLLFVCRGQQKSYVNNYTLSDLASCFMQTSTSTDFQYFKDVRHNLKLKCCHLGCDFQQKKFHTK